MIRIIVLCLFLLVTTVSFGRSLNSYDNIVKAVQAADSVRNEGYSLSLDVKSEKLFIPPGNDSLKLFGIKIFNDDGKELVSKRIADPSKTTAIDISSLPDGNYIIHLITTDREIIRSKFVLKR